MSGGAGPKPWALAAVAGVTAAGGWVVDHDGASPAAAAWLGEFYGVSGGLFLEQREERLNLYCFGPQGQLLPGTASGSWRAACCAAVSAVRLPSGWEDAGPWAASARAIWRRRSRRRERRTPVGLTLSPRW